MIGKKGGTKKRTVNLASSESSFFHAMPLIPAGPPGFVSSALFFRNVLEKKARRWPRPRRATRQSTVRARGARIAWMDVPCARGREDGRREGMPAEEGQQRRLIPVTWAAYGS